MAFEFVFGLEFQVIALITNLIVLTLFASFGDNGKIATLFGLFVIWGIIGVCISGLLYLIFQVPFMVTILSYNLITAILFITVGCILIIDNIWTAKKAKERHKLQDAENINKKIEFEKNEAIEREEEKKRLEDDEKRFEKEKQIAKEEKKRKTLEREQFVQKQTAQGLVAFTDRNGEELWGTPEEIEKIKRIEEDERIKESLLFKVTNSIEEFEPTKDWGNENNYHIELLGWLKREFPDIVEYEVQSGASRPDLVIKEIAIEIKGPTDSQALNTLASKLLRYEQYYTNTIIVLFECNFSEQLFKEIQNGIDRHFQNVKIIRK